MTEPQRHLQCPYCTAYDVQRLYLASTGVDSCECAECGARWEEEQSSGRFVGRSAPDSVLSRRDR